MMIFEYVVYAFNFPHTECNGPWNDIVSAVYKTLIVYSKYW